MKKEFTELREHFVFEQIPGKCAYLIVGINAGNEKVGLTNNPYRVQANNYRNDAQILFYPVPQGVGEIDFVNELIMEKQPLKNTRLNDCFTLHQAYYYLREHLENVNLKSVEALCEDAGTKVYNYLGKKWVRKYVVDDYVREMEEINNEKY